MRDILAKTAGAALFSLAAIIVSLSHAHAKAKVNCDKGQSLQAALDKVGAGETIEVSGTCNERAIIILDNLTLDGGGTAVIDGTGLVGRRGLIHVLASNITIRRITVENGPNFGIAIRRSGSATIQGTIVRDNVSHGISAVQSAYAFIGAGFDNHDNPPTVDSTAGSEGNIISGNGGFGVNVRLSSGAHIFHNNIFGNAKNGINLAEGGSADIDGNNITDNTGINRSGISLSTNASVRLSDHPSHGEVNLIQDNTQGVRCRLGGALKGNPQDFGTGNPGTGGTPHSGDTSISGSCPVASSLAFP